MIYKGSYEDLIYILIGVIWIGYSIYKGVQKNKAAKANKTTTAGTPPKPKSKSFLETFLDELTEQSEKPVEYIPPEEETIVEKDFVTEEKTETMNGERKVFSYDDKYEQSNFDEASDVYKPDRMTGVKMVEKTEHPKKPKTRKTRFNLKKAVIYSEILNPPYF